MFSGNLEYHPNIEAVRWFRRSVWPLIEAKQVRPIIDRTFPLAEAAEAHRLMESGAHIGKILLTIG